MSDNTQIIHSYAINILAVSILGDIGRSNLYKLSVNGARPIKKEGKT